MVRIILLLTLVALGAGSLRAQEWRLEVNRAIERGVVDVLARQNEDGSFQGGHSQGFPMGVTSLALYTLLKSGVPPEDPACKRAIDYLRYLDYQKVYGVSILVFALEATKDPAHHAWIRKAAAWLEDKLRGKDMRWAYPSGETDLSNTQFAILALRIAQKRGYKVPVALWRDVATKLLDSQNDDGGFGYRPSYLPESSGSMTAAGITTLYVAVERMGDNRAFGQLRRRCQEGMNRAWEWLDARFTGTGNPHHSSGKIRDIFPGSTWHYYYLYGLERVATFDQRDEVGDRDWYREGALHLLGTEYKNGGWGRPTDTCFALLFLRRATFTSSNPLEGSVPASLYWRASMDDGSDKGEAWLAPDFDDRRWLRAPGRFGTYDSGAGPFRTGWKTKRLRVRRPLFSKREKDPKLRLFVICDDTLRVWINGVLAGSFDSYGTKYRELTIDAAARDAILKGRNVIAAECINPAGAGAFDLQVATSDRRAEQILEQNEEPKYFRWWREAPNSAGTFLRRWLVLGPIPDSKGELFTKSLLPDATAAPVEGARYRKFAWKPYVADGVTVDFGVATKARNNSTYYAFTNLKVDAEGEYLLWLSADDGIAAWVDGKPVLRHHHKSSRLDRFPVELKLKPGLHRLLLKIHNRTGKALAHVRVTDIKGQPTRSVIPVLDTERPNYAEIARGQPALFTPAQLLEYLETDKLLRLDFSREKDLGRLAVGPCYRGWPKWVRSPGKGDTYRPNPGGRGLLACWPIGGKPTRVIRKVALARDEHQLTLRFSPEAYQKPGKSGARLRVGVFDGELKWLAAEEAKALEKPSGKGWVETEVPLQGYAGKEVLVIIECSGVAAGGYPVVFIDEINIR